MTWTSVNVSVVQGDVTKKATKLHIENFATTRISTVSGQPGLATSALGPVRCLLRYMLTVQRRAAGDLGALAFRKPGRCCRCCSAHIMRSLPRRWCSSMEAFSNAAGKHHCSLVCDAARVVFFLPLHFLERLLDFKQIAGNCLFRDGVELVVYAVELRAAEVASCRVSRTPATHAYYDLEAVVRLTVLTVGSALSVVEDVLI